MNLQEADRPLFGVVEGCLSGQFDRVDELNERASSRYFPAQELQPNFDPRPVPTKYAFFPIIERRAPVKEPIREIPKHSVERNFNPATRRGPVSTYLANIDTETILRNQTVGLQHGADQGVFVPSSTSDLYHNTAVGRPELQTHPLLSETHAYSTRNPITDAWGIGSQQFHNHTRTQLRNLIDETTH